MRFQAGEDKPAVQTIWRGRETEGRAGEVRCLTQGRPAGATARTDSCLKLSLVCLFALRFLVYLLYDVRFFYRVRNQLI